MSKYPVKASGRGRSPALARTAAAVGALSFGVAALSFTAVAPATAEPVPAGCRADTSVRNQLTVECEPGGGVGQHAYIRCTDAVGLKHTHIGTPIGQEGGRSTAMCGPDEAGLT
ncbi:hypothetical protein [Nocardia sp. NPDC052566]|uniref:hypothetical protein n=1 Tax=Nocardia sp. NPDC052566 TaxID=3364330 RepID=UPI0037C4FAE3